jgi:DTW domain-containing protein YfiP
MKTRTGLLILQHPQEQDIDLGTGRLLSLHFDKAVMKVGLSWANLAKALGRPADPKRWAVLYLGSAKPAPSPGVAVVDRRGEPLDGQAAYLAEIDGLIVLDGTWSQAKTLWWRNAWLLKCRRIVLTPKGPSRYGKLRKQARPEGLSTLEAVAQAMARLERNPDLERPLMATFENLIAAFKAPSSVRSAGGAESDTMSS